MEEFHKFFMCDIPRQPRQNPQERVGQVWQVHQEQLEVSPGAETNAGTKKSWTFQHLAWKSDGLGSCVYESWEGKTHVEPEQNWVGSCSGENPTRSIYRGSVQRSYQEKNRCKFVLQGWRLPWRSGGKGSKIIHTLQIGNLKHYFGCILII